MPIPLLPLLALGSGVASSGINALSQGAMNRANRAWSYNMYMQQRQDALADWSRQNLYNSPQAQMNRLRAAGLNPNLVYGNGATATGGDIRGSNAQSPQTRAPEIDLQGPVMGYASMMMQDAQRDILAEQKKLLGEQTMLASINQLKALTEIDKNKVAKNMAEFDLMMKSKMQDINFEYGRLRNDKMAADIRFTLDENERKEIMLGRNVIESTERVLNYQKSRAKDDAEINRINAATDLLRKDARVREYGARLADQGLDPNSPAYIKMVETLVNWLKGGGAGTLPYLRGDETDSFGRPRN